MRNPSGLIIAYATRYLSTTADDAGRAGGHSPFTAALLKNIATPGLDVTDMLRKVGREWTLLPGESSGRRSRYQSTSSMFWPSRNDSRSVDSVRLVLKLKWKGRTHRQKMAP
jgi:hypothetical protein